MICICETWLSQDISNSEIALPGYTLFRKDRSRHGGGVAIYVLTSLNPHLSEPVSSHDLEFVSVSFRYKKLSYHVACFYRPPSSPPDLSSLINLLLSKGPTYTSRLFLAGDFNVNTFAPPSQLTNQLSSLVTLLPLKQIVSSPTHFSHSGTPSIIDLVFIPLSLKPNVSILHPVGSSDHNSVVASISFPHQTPPMSTFNPPPTKIWLYQRADFDSINDSLLRIDWEAVLPHNVDDAWSTFSNLFLSIVHQFTPSKTFSPTPLPSWMSRSLLHKIQKRRRLYHRASSTQDPNDWNLYRSLRNSIVSDIRKAKSHKVDSLSHSPRSFWSYVRSLRKSPSSIPDLKSPPSTVSSDIEKANLLNTTFSNFFTRDSSTQPLLPHCLSQIPEDLLCPPETVASLISSLQNSPSPGPDNITAFLLKASAYAISIPLSIIFNLSIKSGCFPTPWKHSIVVPIPKTSPPSSAPSDYRPISLLSLVSKLLEKHIANILLDHLFSHNLIPPNQFGFLPNRSTTDALITTCQQIHSSLDSSSNVCGIFLDIRKAFDSVSHAALLRKLDSLNLPPNLLSWFSSYLDGRTQSVRVGKSVSSSLPVISGVPQGSILGPLLFIIFFNDIASILPSFSSNMILYADDILLLHTINSPSDIDSINSQLDVISSWLTSKSLHINILKTKYMIFSHRPQAYFDQLPTIKIADSAIDRVSSFKYLGIVLKPNLSWSAHIHLLRKKAKKILGLIYRQFYKHCSSSTLLTLYKTLVRPILEFGSIVWDPPSPHVSDSLEQIQHFALKIISKSWTTDYSSLLFSLGLLSLKHRRKKNKIMSIFKLKNNLSHTILSPLKPVPPPVRFTRYHSIFNFSPIFCKTSTYFNSFFPSAIKSWNSLPESVKSCFSFSLFKSRIDSLSLI